MDTGTLNKILILFLVTLFMHFTCISKEFKVWKYLIKVPIILINLKLFLMTFDGQNNAHNYTW